MKRAFLAAALVAAASAASAEVVGWRGDGSGRYPQATPPTDWGVVAKPVKELSSQAARPKSEGPGKPIPDGVIREWLVLGPVSVPEGRKIDEELLPAEAALSPDAGEKSGELAWKAVTFDAACLDFASQFAVSGKKTGLAAYAHAYVHSPGGGQLWLNLMYDGAARLWLNGKPVHAHSPGQNAAGRVKLDLVKGWNRLLLKVVGGAECWYARAVLYGAAGSEYESRNVLWSARMPAFGCSAPVIVGDRLFATAETGCVVCISKADGKLLWIRSSTYYDAATDEERKASPDVFKELEPLAAKLREMDQSALTSPPDWKAMEERAKVESALCSGMRKVDEAKYAAAPRGEAGFTAPAPFTDGERVYAAFGDGVTVAYDLDGNRKWITLESHPNLEHGYTASPLLVDGRLIVYMGDLRALDAKTGSVLWQRPRFLPEPNNRTYYHFHGSGCVLPAGNEKVAFFPNGEFVRLADGKTVCADFWKLGDARTATPVVDGGVAYKIQSGAGGVVVFKAPPIAGDKLVPEVLKTIKFDTAKYPRFYLNFYNASPLLHEGLLYCVDEDGVLTVVDAAKGEVVYQRMLDLDLYMHHNFAAGRGGASASPTLGGKNIYVFGNQGTCVVFEPGRTYKQVAKNRLEHVLYAGHWRERQEVTMTCPVFEGKRIYYRAEERLYCIGEK